MRGVPAVSIILPCYNAAATLDEALTSLHRQSLKDFELIAIDDGSADGTLSILQAWREKESRLRVLEQPHAGVIAAANWGILESRSEYVARMDADDLAHPERLALQAAYLDENPGIAVVSSLVEVFADNGIREGYRCYVEWLNSLVTNEEIRREIFVESPLANPSVMVRRSWLERMGGYEEHGWAEDYDLWLRMYLAGAIFAKVPEVLLYWRDHPERVTRTESRYSVANFLRAKAYYLARGPLSGRDAVILWGAGMMGRRLGKYLQQEKVPLVLYVDVDSKKIGGTRRGCLVVEPNELPRWWRKYKNPAILAAVGARKARSLIRKRLQDFGYIEGQDWWAAA
jgi:glycosyltransferase involved in cell wall biosynthesis